MYIVKEKEDKTNSRCKSLDKLEVVVPSMVLELDILNDRDFLVTYIVTEFMKTFDDYKSDIENSVRDLTHSIINTQTSLGKNRSVFNTIQIVFDILNTIEFK